MMSKIKTAKGNNEIIFNELRDFLKNNYRNKDKDNYKLKSDSLIQSNMKQIEFTYNMGSNILIILSVKLKYKLDIFCIRVFIL